MCGTYTIEDEICDDCRPLTEVRRFPYAMTQEEVKERYEKQRAIINENKVI